MTFKGNFLSHVRTPRELFSIEVVQRHCHESICRQNDGFFHPRTIVIRPARVVVCSCAIRLGENERSKAVATACIARCTSCGSRRRQAAPDNLRTRRAVGRTWQVARSLQANAQVDACCTPDRYASHRRTHSVRSSSICLVLRPICNDKIERCQSPGLIDEHTNVCEAHDWGHAHVGPKATKVVERNDCVRQVKREAVADARYKGRRRRRWRWKRWARRG